MEKELLKHGLHVNRRHFLSSMSIGLGSVALGSLLIPDLFRSTNDGVVDEAALGVPHFAPKAKRVIYLFQNGAPSQLESFDFKPKLREMWGRRTSGIHTAGTTADRNDSKSKFLPPGRLHL